MQQWDRRTVLVLWCMNVKVSVSQEVKCVCVCLFDSSPAHSGLSSSKFTAKSCETSMWGREHKATHIKPNTQHYTFSPIYHWQTHSLFMLIKSKLRLRKRSKILSSRNSPCNCKHTYTHPRCPTLKSGGISAPKPNAGNILSLDKERDKWLIEQDRERYRGKDK